MAALGEGTRQPLVPALRRLGEQEPEVGGVGSALQD
jgi:hypothetical protein